MRDYLDLLKDFEADAWLVEPHDKPITIDSHVCITPYHTKTKLWTCGMNIIVTLQEIIEQKVPIVVQDKELEEFLDQNYQKER